MNLLRLAFKYAPQEANKIIKKINADDKNFKTATKIAGLLKSTVK